MSVNMLMAAGILVTTCCFLSIVLATEDARRPPSILIGPKGHKVFDTVHKFELDCIADGIPEPTYEWTKNGLLFDVNEHSSIATSANGTLSFQQAVAQDEGYYQCLAMNNHGKALSDVIFLQMARLGSFPNAQVADFQVEEGHNLTLPCEQITSIPRGTYQWSTVESPIDEYPMSVNLNKRINIDDKGYLYFANMKTTDQNRFKPLYACIVYNSYLDRRTTGSYAKITVRPDNPVTRRSPVLQFQTPSPAVSIMGKDNSQISLRCLFSGYPTPNVTWEKVGGALPAGRYQLKKSGTELIIDPIEKSDQGDYVCKGTNSAQTEAATIKVEVKEVPKFKAGDNMPKNINATEGQNVRFLCVPTNNTDTTIEWFINGAKLAEDSERFDLSTNRDTLTINNVCRTCEDGLSDLMNVQCNISNAYGYAYAGGYLNVFPSDTASATSLSLSYGLAIFHLLLVLQNILYCC